MIQIGIVDDKSLNRKMIRQNLYGISNIEIILEAVNGLDFLEKIKALNLQKLPNVVLIDLDMPAMNGIETIAIASIRFPTIKFIVLTVFDDDEKIFEAIKAGASGYLLKDDAPDMLLDAIHNAYELNGAPMSPAIARKTLLWLKQGAQPYPTPSTTTDHIRNSLTDREQEILKYLVEGQDYKKIASTLFISPQTVRTHISRIYEKLHINSKAQAIQLAHKYNWN
ncbi:MAG: response regulator transcription factor [Sediminibacterium sp.]|jgi:DNA-binding NarL/FixJ family response regulator|uniref:LuxR C-terminal-related transcriptional regulator n=1 Tax=Sediminibacterium sp. TaxID=1917865 RepID=UPI001B4DB4D4|nr:response regulator transcription factor [Sediminibacterium sp.]MBP7346419.1 response regulator transcription factor [Sediminibacterium sp.]MDO8997372.1 response regulator transcription factor [Sediminibacterium sp.]